MTWLTDFLDNSLRLDPWVQQDILLRIGEIVRHHGADLAHPTQTVQVEGKAPFAGRAV